MKRLREYWNCKYKQRFKESMARLGTVLGFLGALMFLGVVIYGLFRMKQYRWTINGWTINAQYRAIGYMYCFGLYCVIRDRIDYFTDPLKGDHDG